VEERVLKRREVAEAVSIAPTNLSAMNKSQEVSEKVLLNCI